MKLLGVSGSLRAASLNSALLQSILYGRGFESDSRLSSVQVSVYEGLGNLPHYNSELDQAEGPAAVAHWRAALANADGVIICTPEYAFGMPGVLKNALDWIASSGELVDKPLLAISASPGYTGGDKAHAALLLTLGALSAHVIQSGSISIPAVQQKLDAQNRIIDSDLMTALLSGLHDLQQRVEDQKTNSKNQIAES